MDKKLDRLRELLQQEKVEAALLFSPENFYYVTGLASHQHTVSRSPSFATALFSTHDHFHSQVIVMDFEQPTFQKNTSFLDIHSYDTWVGVRDIEQLHQSTPESVEPMKTIFDRLGDLLQKYHLNDKIIGIELDFMPFNFYHLLVKHFPQIQFVDISSLMIRARGIKSQEEIALFQQLTEVQDEALNYATQFIEIGRSEEEIAQIYRSKVMESGFCIPSAWSMFSTGKNASALGLPTSNVIVDGDIFKYDGGVNASFNCYTTDFARSYIIGEADPLLVKVKQRLYDAQRKMIDAIKPGLSFNKLFHIGFDYVAQQYPAYKRGHLGHSISLGPQTAEPPFISNSTESTLQANMILCVEVPLYIKGIGGFNIEDMILVTPQGAQVLTYRTPHFLEKEARI